MRAIFQERRGKDVHIFTLFTKKEKGGEKERKDYGYWYILFTSRNGLDKPDHLRVGDYRIIYSVDDSRKNIKILDIAHRREVYL